MRRYILDLFNIELSDEVVKKLGEHAARFKMQTTSKEARARASRAMSILGRPARPRHISESDGESVSEDEEPQEIKKYPVLNLRPQTRVVGFE